MTVKTLKELLSGFEDEHDVHIFHDGVELGLIGKIFLDNENGKILVGN